MNAVLMQAASLSSQARDESMRMMPPAALRREAVHDSATVDFHADESAGSVARSPRLAQPLRVLLAEDCATNRLLACALMSHWGVEPRIAVNGAEAVQMARDESFDLILMDIEMPVVDGLVAAMAIREHERDNPGQRRVPIVAYTAGELASQPDILSRSGIDAVLTKPCDAGELGALLHHWCKPPGQPTSSS